MNELKSKLLKSERDKEDFYRNYIHVEQKVPVQWPPLQVLLSSFKHKTLNSSTKEYFKY